MFRTHALSHLARNRRCGRSNSHELDLRQTEIENHRMSTLGYKNVGRFDVAVNDFLNMSSIQSVGNP